MKRKSQRHWRKKNSTNGRVTQNLEMLNIKPCLIPEKINHVICQFDLTAFESPDLWGLERNFCLPKRLKELKAHSTFCTFSECSRALHDSWLLHTLLKLLDVWSGHSSLFTCRALSLSCAPWFPDSEWSSTQLVCADRDRVVLAKLTMLKYVHVLLPATQCESVNAQSCVCGAQLFSASDQQSGWAAAACSARIKMQCVWITAVCLWGGHVHSPEPPQREYLGLHWYACHPNLTLKTGRSPSWFFHWFLRINSFS